MPAHAVTVPCPCPGPILARTARPLITGLVVLWHLSSAPGPLFLGFCFSSASGSPVCITIGQSLQAQTTCWITHSPPKLPHHNTVYSSQSVYKEEVLQVELGTFPAHVPPSSPKWCGCPGPSCRLDGSCQCIRDKFPSPAAVTSDRCPALPCPALAASCLVLGRLVGRPTSLIVDRALPICPICLSALPSRLFFVSLFIAV